ncbi:M23 family metallopeptidase [Paeniglutamicibacter psychrophenolicus]|uniref:M23 family metallopeptidase n=1 Tax=Paeniglutamicibacter psychrophenolicus TaxID=257454 RepID=UPI00278067F2|nr:M23 family metallopeptidase [Paeniglutamicibacter psychrophenolicus]MDQ0094882.1 murein DD-endopeptidase MepM/ murein hydrolase activator NlpD [Paeniglutamicibacter psychrophenolicus]
MTQQQNSGRRRASNPVDASPANGSMEQIVDTALNGESTSRRPGRRAASAIPDSVENPETLQYGGRRFVASPRYAASPETASIAATEIPAAPVARTMPLAMPAEGDKLDNVLKSAPRTLRPRLGFVHKLAAVAAVTGLAFAAAPAQESDEVVAAPQRVAQTSVADVKAPANDKLTVDRASVTSKYVKVVKPAPVTTAAAGKVAKKTKPAPATTADTGKVTRLSQPVDSIRLTSRFGFRKNPTGPGYMNHNGLDFAVPSGTPIKAAAAGTVVQAEWAGHSGFRVKIDHGNGLETSYNHNSALKVSVGQKVERGETVSLAGSTGNSTGPHLHLEVIVNGEWVNPEGWL